MPVAVVVTAVFISTFLFFGGWFTLGNCGVFSYEVNDLFFQESVLDVADLVVVGQFLDVFLRVLVHLLGLHRYDPNYLIAANLQFLLLNNTLLGEEPSEIVDGVEQAPVCGRIESLLH